MKKKAPYKSKIKGHEWSFHGQTNAAYVRKHGSDSSAITYTKDREIYFNLSCMAPDYVRHELLHAYIASSSTNSSNLDADQVEELCCEIFGEFGPEIDLLADKILNYYLR